MQPFSCSTHTVIAAFLQCNIKKIIDRFIAQNLKQDPLLWENV
jgi:hypothetical protein